MAMNCFTLLTFNLAFMVICIVLRKQHGENFMGTIKDETSEWNLGAIVDIKAVNAKYDNITSNVCGDGYELQPSTFLGTKSYCIYPGGFYIETSSSTRKRNCIRVIGIEEQNMNIHKNNVICIKRNPELTYHILLENFRKESCATGIKCGS
jgi:hypothetical protein